MPVCLNLITIVLLLYSFRLEQFAVTNATGSPTAEAHGPSLPAAGVAAGCAAADRAAYRALIATQRAGVISGLTKALMEAEFPSK